MKNIHREHENNTIWFRKTWDLTHGYGYHVQIYWKRFFAPLNRTMYTGDITYGFSKNKFTAVKMALKK